MTLDPAIQKRLEERRGAPRDHASIAATPGEPRPEPDTPCVLVIDDEPEITRSVAELLGRDYQVLTANSADEALALLESHRVAVILTDQRMPDGTGAELLARTLAIAPEATRILFTGYSDISAVIDAVNLGQVYRYIAKPWRPDELRAIIAQALERYGLVFENRRLLEELTRANEDLGSANGELQAYVYSIAHDVRAPLRSIDGFTALAMRDAGPVLPESSHRHLGRVREAAQRMGTMIDELLALSQVSRRSLVREQVDLSEMAATLLADLRAAEPSRPVETTVAPGLIVDADRKLLRVILSNLVGNAWKFSATRDPARIVVGSEVVAGELAFLVRDNGVGFDPAHATHLFGLFQRAHPADAFEGEGIGLATVQRLVARHGGRAWAEARVDGGATFFFTLPARP